MSKADVLIREPQIDSTGTMFINNFCGYGELFRQVGLLGSNLIVTGEISLQAHYSDKFILIRDLAIDGKIIRPDPLYGYDELGSLTNLTSVHVVLFAIAGAIIYFLSRDKIMPDRQSTWFKI